MGAFSLAPSVEPYMRPLTWAGGAQCGHCRWDPCWGTLWGHETCGDVPKCVGLAHVDTCTGAF
eukprot:959828-Pyramimonas_sp.AAC.1